MKIEMKKKMPFAEYLAVDACHKSALGNVGTAKHLKQFKEKKPDSDALRFGRIFHTALLEPELMENLDIYDDQIWIPKASHPDKKSINDQKNDWKDIRIKSDIGYYKNEGEKTAIASMVKAIMDNPLAKDLLSGPGTAEASLFWQDYKTSLPCKTRLDWLREDDIMVEVKTDVDPSPEKFGKKAYNMGYHIGAWFNREGFRAVMGRDIKAFVYIVIEKTAPFSVGVYSMNAHDFDSGEIYTPPLMKRYQLIQQGGLQDHNQGEDGKYEIMPLQTPGWELRIVEDEQDEIIAPYEDEGSEL